RASRSTTASTRGFRSCSSGTIRGPGKRRRPRPPEENSMANVPENHVTAEGRNLRAAIESAATQLGVAPGLVEHKLDLAHFRSASGSGVGVGNVRLVGWAEDP